MMYRKPVEIDCPSGVFTLIVSASAWLMSTLPMTPASAPIQRIVPIHPPRFCRIEPPSTH